MACQRRTHGGFWQRRTATVCAGAGDQSLRGFEMSAPSGDVGRCKAPVTALESGLEQTVAGQSWKSHDDVQDELQVAELEDEFAMLQTGCGGGVEKCCGERRGTHAPAPFAQA